MDTLAVKWSAMDRLLGHSGPFAGSDFVTDDDDSVKQFIRYECRVLVVGAGALGCEMLKSLAMCGFSQLHVVDVDTIDLSNLNRQFLFREPDMGQSKAEVAARALQRRVPSCRVQAHHVDLTTLTPEFYRQFHVVVAGLDSIEARRWLNATLVSLVQCEHDAETPDPSTVIPMVDGGTEGLAGQARVILPRLSACFECTLSLFPMEARAFPLCTLASTPRLPEHCIEYASAVLWPQSERGRDAPLDVHDPGQVQWVYERAVERAEAFGIGGVTYALTLGVLRGVVPAVASTNAMIGSACALEVLKLATHLARPLNDWMAYNGAHGVYVYPFANERRPDCAVCGRPAPLRLRLPRSATLNDLLEVVAAHAELRARRPSIVSDSRPLYMATPPALQEATRVNLPKRLADQLQLPSRAADRLEYLLSLTDPSMPLGRQLLVVLEEADAAQPATDDTVEREA
ncbi:hypothetical protein CDCA_CDCA07G2087 [Cyanidium caldarium]|uniref:NEDD8-activating enzyme E1 catalytic subunit n=1 Tax=Cyanidium caldarium TaxID=2771 RepID=A0AAV9IUX3_CYACA|nr:hypothetical protein CDCA_CDCA07G2087 [Cyanidium caldarium]